MTADTLTWLVARTGGFVAYGLLTISVAYGLLLSTGWKNPRWTRFVTNEVHRFVTLLALAFTAVHGIAIALDSFVGIGLVGALVPFASTYRPIWLALGIVGAYLLLAVYLSERVRDRIGYAWWRRFHTVAFLAFLMALVHGVATGSDTRSVFGMAVYGGSVALVGGLLAFRLFPAPPKPAKPLGALLSIAAGAAVLAFAALGPLAPGWSARAGGELPAAVAAAQRLATTEAAGGSAGVPSPSPVPSAPNVDGAATGMGAALGGLPLDSGLAFEGRLGRPRFGDDDDDEEDEGRAAAMTVLQGRLSDGTAVFAVRLLPGEAATTGLLQVETGDGSTCEGPVTALTERGLEAACATADGTAWKVSLEVSGRRDVTGTLTFAAWAGGTPEPARLGPGGSDEEYEDHDGPGHHDSDDDDGDDDSGGEVEGGDA